MSYFSYVFLIFTKLQNCVSINKNILAMDAQVSSAVSDLKQKTYMKLDNNATGLGSELCQIGRKALYYQQHNGILNYCHNTPTAWPLPFRVSL